MRILPLLISATLALSACSTTTPQAPRMGPDGKPLPKVYKMPRDAESKIPYEVLDSVNALRAAAGAPPLQLNAKLTAAAATHSLDMSRQNRPWHFGSDGSSPIDRVERVGYQGRLVGEDISETYETELETLAAWSNEEDTRRVMLDKSATDMGLAWYQEPTGKIWWTMVVGSTLPDPGTERVDRSGS
ncbi:CAP domain-containing protein [Pseudooceanicola sp. CBS1P-1]|uniref:CAP domain-containing protein n=1 Tax=Pseudooceanicola albus TaxID=2692189 RepID=A0A6L7FZP0_9RHOB|nr:MULTISPECIES: CAP domain-containing protein [Pseudooceanicola]MBT9383868.1 CAP domain-containing protein [Pseudooceanicola endophyticus]MXN16718.1 CAP domain-containing protein [Pseudooceanicola albus]